MWCSQAEGGLPAAPFTTASASVCLAAKALLKSKAGFGMPLRGETFGSDDAWGGVGPGGWWGCWVLSGSHSVSHTSLSGVTDKRTAYAVYV